MTGLAALPLEELKALEAEVSARRDAHAELGKALTPYNRANSVTPLDDRIYEIASEILRREQPIKEAAEAAAFAAEWTLERFSARRDEWNVEFAKLPRSSEGVHISDVRDLEDRLGYTVEALKRAKAMFGLGGRLQAKLP